jgi:hypothetical protein
VEEDPSTPAINIQLGERDMRLLLSLCPRVVSLRASRSVTYFTTKNKHRTT